MESKQPLSSELIQVVGLMQCAMTQRGIGRRKLSYEIKRGISRDKLCELLKMGKINKSVLLAAARVITENPTLRWGNTRGGLAKKSMRSAFATKTKAEASQIAECLLSRLFESEPPNLRDMFGDDFANVMRSVEAFFKHFRQQLNPGLESADKCLDVLLTGFAYNIQHLIQTQQKKMIVQRFSETADDGAKIYVKASAKVLSKSDADHRQRNIKEEN